MKQYILNKETGKIELSFSKEEYKALSDSDQKEMRRYYLFSGSRKAWVSRSKNNHYMATQIAIKLGFADGGYMGERLSFAEEVERQAEKAEARSERYEKYADNAEKRADSLQSEWTEARKDWSFVTQPNINSGRGRAFTNHRQRLLDRYTKGFEEYRKSEYFREKAITAEQTASMEKFKSRSYLSNRIEECNKNIREYEKRMIKAEESQNESYVGSLLERMEYELDKLAYLYNKLDELGGVLYDKTSVKKGYMVKIRGDWETVVKGNSKTVEVKPDCVSYTLKYAYAEIQELKIPDDWKEEKNTFINPFTVKDIVVRCSYDGKKVIKAFQVVKTTNKNVVIQEIAISNENIPEKDNFISDKQERRSVKVSRGNNVVNYDDWFLYKYQEDMSFASVY
ncbi:hypothetical protein BSK59_13090 [Paenibacillus odorifer]|uniref:DUF3560 domain-containing protein n=1 Tax=Paenibacillus odorifer TaxID=189426 RepID=UPI00096F1084|nr:DUF3560 domain-containing protein [Paenibacillus odorifer]OME55408.1 hypothetical protein BSK59_13090 [Paenibacillus odorifer]